jgi:hypothetical protein
VSAERAAWKRATPELIVAIKAALRSDPQRSNGELGRAFGVSRTTIYRCRMKLEQAGEISARALMRDVPKLEAHPHLDAGTLADGTAPAVKHGAKSPALIAPLRDRFLTELRDRFPACDDQLLALQAHRAAQIELLGRFIEERGVIRTRSGECYNAVRWCDKLSTAYENQHARLMAMQREAEQVEPTAQLEAVVSEIVEARNAG